MIPDLRKYSMTDVGTRLEHLADLQELWSFALGIETAGGFQSVPSIERSQKLSRVMEAEGWKVSEATVVLAYLMAVTAVTHDLMKAEQAQQTVCRKNLDNTNDQKGAQ